MFKVELLKEIYSVLEKHASASTEYYDREIFIYHYGVIKNSGAHLPLKCTDGSIRHISRDDDLLCMTGNGSQLVNSIIKKIIEKDG